MRFWVGSQTPDNLKVTQTTFPSRSWPSHKFFVCCEAFFSSRLVDRSVDWGQRLPSINLFVFSWMSQTTTTAATTVTTTATKTNTSQIAATKAAEQQQNSSSYNNNNNKNKNIPNHSLFLFPSLLSGIKTQQFWPQTGRLHKLGNRVNLAAFTFYCCCIVQTFILSWKKSQLETCNKTVAAGAVTKD